MTLRGELDSFPLETVVQLIHSTNKTGQLEVRGTDSTGGTLGFDGGRLVAAIAGEDAGEPALGAIFAVSVGVFEFIPWNETPAANLSGDLDQLLDTAVEERDRIVAIRKVIPDDRSRFRLSERAAEKGNITLEPDQWRTLLAVNGDRDVNGVADHLKSGKLAARAALAALVDAGFIDVLEPAPEPAPEPAQPASSPPPAPEPVAAPEQWSPPAPVWVAPAPETPAWAPEPAPVYVAPVPEPEVTPEPEPATEPERWSSPEPLGQSWEQPAPPAPAQTWEPAPAQQWETPQPDLRADLAAALDARMSAPVVEPEVAHAPSPVDIPAAQDERLAALSGVFAPAAPAPVEPPPPAEPAPLDRINEWSRMAPETHVPPPVEEKKKGLFGFLKKEDASKDAPVSTAGSSADVTSSTGVGRAGQLASFSNALLAEYNSGTYGKGRLDDRMANLLMRVDEQADPIDRPLPIVDDRIDAQALDRENVPEAQAVPYLAILVSQIYEDAERTFGKDKAKKGYRAAQQQVFGADASALTAPDVSGRLPKV